MINNDKYIEVIEYLVRLIIGMIGGDDIDYDEIKETLAEINLDLDDYIVY